MSSLSDGPAEAVDDAGAPALDPAHVVLQDANRVDLVREPGEPLDHGDGDVRTHESRTLERITGAGNVPEGSWQLTSAGPCVQRLVGDDGVGAADVALAETPAQDETAWACWCASRHVRQAGAPRDAERWSSCRRPPEHVRLRLGVRRLDGDQSCQANPATPVTVELADPLGDREVVDSSVVPAPGLRWRR